MTTSAPQWQPAEADTPPLTQLSPQLVVDFAVVQATDSQVVWINHGWFAERGVDLSEPSSRRQVEQWLIDTFAFVVPAEEHVHAATTTFGADRYGSNNSLFAHGGSGRAALVGHFHVKGVGQTPLVGKGVNREHSHGNASLNVAIREAIYAEVFRVEFPHGAIPVVAILDTGLQFASSGDPNKMLRRALIVRPAMVRPAHLQRAAGFIEPVDGHHNRQTEDVERVRQMMAWVLQGEQGRPALQRIDELFKRTGRQIAYGQVHRLYSGGYFSSNLSIEGEILDFGNAHAFADWANYKVLMNDLGFGRELENVSAMARSLGFHIRKYAGMPVDENVEQQWMAAAYTAHAERFAIESRRMLGAPRSKDAAPPSADCRFVQVFKAQQRVTVNCASGQASPLPAAASVLQEPPHDGLTARRFLRARDRIDRGALQEASNRLLEKPVDTNTLSERVTAFIDTTVGASRRDWPELPEGLSVVAHASSQGSSALYCLDQSFRPCVWIEGYAIQGQLAIFQQKVDVMDEPGQRLGQGRIGRRCDVQPEGAGFCVDGLGIVLPAPSVIYDDALYGQHFLAS